MTESGRHDRWLRFLPVTVLVLGLVGSFGVNRWEASSKADRRKHRFEHDTSLIVSSIKQALRRYEDMNTDTSKVSIDASGTRRTQEEFDVVLSSLLLDSRFPGTFGIAWADSVPTASLAAFMADQSVPRSTLEDLAPAAASKRTAVVTLAGPPSTMGIALGVDARLFPQFASALDRTTDRATSQATAKFVTPLRIGPDRKEAPILVLLLRPMYSTGSPPATVEERRLRVIGFAGVALDTKRFVPAVLGVNGSRYAVSVFDGAPTPKNRLGESSLDAAPHGQRDVVTIPVFGRTWSVQVEDAKVIDYNEDDLSIQYLLAGLVLTGTLFGVVWLLTRSERRARQLVDRATAELSRKASEDSLTGLVNRSELMTRLQNCRAQAHPGAIGPTLFFMDLDRFKIINDSFGHSVGDELLIEVARRLTVATRDADTVARFGGDEFVIMVTDFVDNDALGRITSRLQDAFIAPVRAGDRYFDISASIGIARAVDDSWTPASLIRDADVAMYDAKNRSPGTSSVFEQALGRRASDRLAIVNGFSDALKHDEFEMEYQPIVITGSRELIGYEALLRWNHPERGRMSAGQFIEIAEESGAVVPIGTWVMDTACAAAAAWETAPGQPEQSVWINVSGKQIARPGFVEVVTAALERGGLAPSRLCLEISERALVPEVLESAERLEHLQRMGVKIAIDDFGSGGSSFAQVKYLPVDVLKLDRTFVERLSTSEEDRAIVRAMIEFAHALGITTVAEGVEHEVQATELAALGCDALQGWLTGRPT